jgi:outer membrane receptor protein involved in Fe transport
VGVTGKLQHSATDGVIPLVPAADMKSGGIFLLERAEQGPLTLLAGIRSDLAQVSPDGYTARAFDAFTWSAGAAWHLTDAVSVTGNVGTAWRAPTLFELYASGPRLGEARYEIGREDLDKETSLNLDAGVRWQADRVRGHVAVYRNDFEHFLYIQPSDQVRDGYQVFYYQQADARLEGTEGSLEVEAAPFLTVYARGDYVRGTNQTEDEPLPLMPPRRITGGAEIHGAWPSGDSWAFLGAEVESVAKPDRLNPFDFAVDGYTLLHFSAGWRGDWMGREAGVDLRVRNAANTEYRAFLSRYKAFALNPGRDVVLRVRMSF